MKDKYKRVYSLFYIAIILTGIYNLTFLILEGNVGFEEIYESFTSYGLSPIMIFFSIFTFLIFVMSIVLLVKGVYKKIPKEQLIVPTYYIFYYFVWGFLVSLVAGYLFLPNDPAIVIDILSKYDPVFYMINIILPGVYLHKLLRK